MQNGLYFISLSPKDAQLLNIGTTLLRKKYPKKKRGEEQGVIY